MGKVINILNNVSTYIVQQVQCSQTRGKYDHIQLISSESQPNAINTLVPLLGPTSILAEVFRRMFPRKKVFH